MMVCSRKLKLLKSHLRTWHRDIFMFFTTWTMPERNFLTFRQTLQIMASLYKILDGVKYTYCSWKGASFSDFFLKEKARLKWLHNEGRNITFFHWMVKLCLPEKSRYLILMAKSRWIDKKKIKNACIGLYFGITWIFFIMYW